MSESQWELVDLQHLGRERAIGAWLLDDVIVDPGPSSCLPRLLEALDGRAPRVIALTHIHLDHAGATGSLLQLFPDAEVWVHERGARHLVNPEKLLASATRLYGEHMQTLWGEVLAAPAERVRVLSGGESLGGFRVEYTPGHASHHVSYLHEASARAFTGDVAGVRIGMGPVLAPTPPPDIDLDAWRTSLDVIETWSPRSLGITHFGAVQDVPAHIAALRDRLDQLQSLAGALDEEGFTAAVQAELAAGGAEVVASYAHTMPPGQSYQGLRRYLDRC